MAAKDGGPLTEFDRLTLHQAVTVVALELLRRRVADDTERRLAGDVLTAMVSGELDGGELARRLEPFGLRDRAAVLVLTPPRPLKAATEDALARALRDEAPAGLAAGTGQFSCVLLASAARRRRRGAVRARRAPARTRLAGGRRRARRRRRAGWCPPASCGAPSTRRAARSRRAGSPSTARPPASPPTATWARSSCCSRCRTTRRCGLFCDSILAPIEEGEGAYGGELMRSLEAFIECNGQWERAARQLYCHRHTLRYRIRRVEELTGRSLDSARDRIDFWLALRGRELIRH